MLSRAWEEGKITHTTHTHTLFPLHWIGKSRKQPWEFSAPAESDLPFAPTTPLSFPGALLFSFLRTPIPTSVHCTLHLGKAHEIGMGKSFVFFTVVHPFPNTVMLSQHTTIWKHRDMCCWLDIFRMSWWSRLTESCHCFLLKRIY